MVKRKYLIVGITALLLMVPLAVTSTNAMIKRLGGKRWRALHRLAYVAAICGVIHYYMQVKADVRQPLAFAAVLAVLLGYRLVVYLRRPKPAPAAAAAAKPKIWSGPMRVASIVEETPDVRTFRFAAPDGQPLPFEHQPGQYLVLSLLINGKKVNRTYTIASSPTQTDLLRNHGQARGERLRSRATSTRRSAKATWSTFPRPPAVSLSTATQAASIVLIAGGVGITPLMSILRYLTDQNWKGEIHFVYTAKTPRDIIFRRELEDLQKRFPNLRLHVTLTRAEGTDWTGKKGRITAELLQQAIPDLVRHPVYICGPASMMEPTIQLLRELGVPAEQIKSEAFVAAKRAETVAVDSAAAAAVAVPSPLREGDSSAPALTLALSAKSVPLDRRRKRCSKFPKPPASTWTTNAAPAFAAGARPSSSPAPSPWKFRTPSTKPTNRTTSFCSARPKPPSL